MRIKIGGISAEALVDSGSNITMAHENLFDAFINNGYTLVPFEAKVTVANSDCMQITGKALVSLVVGSRCIKHTVYLTKNLCQAAILGFDAIKALEAVIDGKNCTFELKHSGRPNEIVTATHGYLTGCETMQALETDMELNDPMDYHRKSVVPAPEDYCFPHPAITPEKANEIRALIAKWQDSFATSTGKTDVDQLRIVVDESKPPLKTKFIRMSPAHQKLAHEEARRLMAEGVLTYSDSNFSSPCFLHIDPSRRKTRLICDFSGLNQRIIGGSSWEYPMASMQDVLESIQDAQFLCTVDLESAFWSLPVEEKSQQYLSFSLQGFGSLTWSRAPLGLKNLPALWTKTIQRILEPARHCSAVFFDDIILFSKDYEGMLAAIDLVMSLLRKAELRIQWVKCKWFHRYVPFLGMIVGEGTIRPHPDRISAIQKIVRPTTQRQLRGWIGAVNFLRRFYPNVAEKMAPMQEMLKKNAKVIWTEERSKAFEEVKKMLTIAPVLGIVDYDKPMELHVDSSGLALAGALIQRDGEKPIVLAYASRALSKTEKNYSAVQREALALLYCAEHWKSYLLGHKTTVYTDSSALTFLRSIRGHHGMLGRWIVRLSAFDFELKHVAGSRNVIPDFLSRNPYEQEEERDKFEMAALNLMPADPDFSTTTDDWYKGLREKVLAKPRSYPAFRVIRDTLYKVVRDPTTKKEVAKLVVPTEARRDLIKKMHAEPASGHCGGTRTFKRMAQHFYFPKMQPMVRRFVQRCEECQQYKTPNTKNQGTMNYYKGPLAPFQMIQADLIGNLPVATSARYQYILVIVDSATRWPIIRPVQSSGSADTIKVLTSQVFPAHGYPEILLTDQGSTFTSKVFRKFCADRNIKLNTCSPYSPQQNGLCEVYNKHIKIAVSIFCKGNHKKWPEHLPEIEFALRTAVCETTGFSPDVLLYGRPLRPIVSPHPPTHIGATSPFDPADHLEQLRSTQQLLYKKAEGAIRQAKIKQTKIYNLRMRPPTFIVGQLVWKRNFEKSSAADAVVKKLCKKWVGPKLIVALFSDSQVEIEDLDGKNRTRCHTQHLRPAYQNPVIDDPSDGT